VGRSPYADIVIADPSVAEYHAEIVMAADGRIFIGDCGSAAGTWRMGEGAAWQPLRQAFVDMDDTVRFGDHECVLTDILSPVLPSPQPGRTNANREARPAGRLSRDPWTGEIVRRGR
jgi:pSer/pThr/pTyr-binding forkhead associated (FHA) protein